MTVRVNDIIPPMLEFWVHEFEDRNATIEKGEFVGIPTDMVTIKPHGSRDTIDRVYSEWLKHIKEQANVGRFPKDWIAMIQKKYSAWKEGTPMPSFGTPLKGWEHADPNTLKACLAARITTIEELASASEESLRHLGMNSRILKKKAEMYVNQEKIPSSEEIKQSLKD